MLLVSWGKLHREGKGIRSSPGAKERKESRGRGDIRCKDLEERERPGWKRRLCEVGSVDGRGQI